MNDCNDDHFCATYHQCDWNSFALPSVIHGALVWTHSLEPLKLKSARTSPRDWIKSMEGSGFSYTSCPWREQNRPPLTLILVAGAAVASTRPPIEQPGRAMGLGSASASTQWKDFWNGSCRFVELILCIFARGNIDVYIFVAFFTYTILYLLDRFSLKGKQLVYHSSWARNQLIHRRVTAAGPTSLGWLGWLPCVAQRTGHPRPQMAWEVSSRWKTRSLPWDEPGSLPGEMSWAANWFWLILGGLVYSWLEVTGNQEERTI